MERTRQSRDSDVIKMAYAQDQDGVLSVVVKWRSDAFCEEFRRDTLIEIIETNDDDEIDQCMCFSAEANEVRFFIRGHTELSIAEIEYVSMSRTAFIWIIEYRWSVFDFSW